MSAKNNTDVVINGRIYTLSGFESEDYLQKVAGYINTKINELMQDTGYKRQKPDVQSVLLELNIADDYFKVKKQADSIDSELQTKEQQIYDIKHELIASQIENETAKKEISDLNNQINELKMQIVRLETESNDSKTKRKKTTA